MMLAWVKRVADQGVFRPQEGLEQPGVGVEAGRVQDSILGAHELGQAPLQLLVYVLGAADEAD